MPSLTPNLSALGKIDPITWKDTYPYRSGNLEVDGCERSWRKLGWRHLRTSLPLWRCPFRTTSSARLGFVDENLSVLGLQRQRLWRQFLLQGVSRLFSSSAPLFCCCCLAMVVLHVLSLVVFDMNALGWLPELVVFASWFLGSWLPELL